MNVVAFDSSSCTPLPQSRVAYVPFSSDTLTNGGSPPEYTVIAAAPESLSPFLPLILIDLTSSVPTNCNFMAPRRFRKSNEWLSASVIAAIGKAPSPKLSALYVCFSGRTKPLISYSSTSLPSAETFSIERLSAYG